MEITKDVSKVLQDAILNEYCARNGLQRENVERAGKTDKVLSKFARSFYKPGIFRRIINTGRRFFCTGGYGRPYTTEELSTELSVRGIDSNLAPELVRTKFPSNRMMLDPFYFVRDDNENGKTTYRLHIPSQEPDLD